MERESKHRKTLSQDEIGILFLIAATIFGAWFRFYPVIQAGFPINDGGLFLVMVETLQENNYLLPGYFHYNGLTIPFAYPPLAFYITGIVQSVTKMPHLELFRWMPATFTTLTIPAFFILAKKLLNSSFQAGLASLIYALLPRTITWLVMGGGITRSLGQLFLILAIYQIYPLFQNSSPLNIFKTISISSMVCLTHPEAAIQTLGITIILFAFNLRNKKSWIISGVVGAGTILATSIWWIPLLSRFGLSPILSASQTGFHSEAANVIGYIISTPFSEEPLITIIMVLGIIGLIVQLARKEFFLPLFYLAPFIIDPRSAPTVSTVPMAISASIALSTILLPGLANLDSTTQYKQPTQSTPEKILLAYFGLLLVISMQYYGLKLSDRRVPEENLDVFSWVANNIPEGSNFIILTGQQNLFLDSTQEWFPVYSKSYSLTTIQGQEWLLEDQFINKVNELQQTQLCVNENNPFECIEERINNTFDYILITSSTIESGSNKLVNPSTIEMAKSMGYIPIYITDSLFIFSRKE